MSDIDGNVYQTISIGTKTWMAENLKVTHYSNSMAIPNITVNWGNLSTGAYCWYNNDEAAYKDTYGALYNYYAVYDSNHLCPTGWHIPNYSEWIDLTRNLGGDSIAGGKMKEACTKHWAFPNAGASNESGFTALPGGYCNSNGLCYDIGKGGHWWCLKEFNNDYSKQMIVSCQVTAAYITNVDINVGISVRCVKD
jgi:uncharacterized protein (TIGR02145 family)